MAKNLIGQQFGRLTVVSQSFGRSKEGRLLWLCQCSCGNTKITDTKSLTTTISEWSDITGINKTTLRLKLNAGWSIKDALTINPIPGGNYGT